MAVLPPALDHTHSIASSGEVHPRRERGTGRANFPINDKPVAVLVTSGFACHVLGRPCPWPPCVCPIFISFLHGSGSSSLFFFFQGLASQYAPWAPFESTGCTPSLFFGGWRADTRPWAFESTGCSPIIFSAAGEPMRALGALVEHWMRGGGAAGHLLFESPLAPNPHKSLRAFWEPSGTLAKASEALELDSGGWRSLIPLLVQLLGAWPSLINPLPPA